MNSLGGLSIAARVIPLQPHWSLKNQLDEAYLGVKESSNANWRSASATLAVNREWTTLPYQVPLLLRRKS